MVATKTVGPWPNGLNLTNNRDLSTYLAPTELGEATNVTYSQEGFVEPRPGFKKYLYDFGTYDTIEVIGELVLPDGTSAVFIQTITGVTPNRQAKVFLLSDKDDCSLILTPAVDTVFTHVLSYESVAVTDVYTGVFLFADQVNKSMWNTKLDLTGTWAVIPSQYSVPASKDGFIVKDRLFLFDYNTSKMWWSPANYIVDYGLVDQANYGDDKYSEEPIESTGSADRIRAVEFYNNNFYIFKKNKTFMFTYQSLPGEDGYLRKVSDNMGAFDSTMFRNAIIVINAYGVFRLDGTEFVDLQRQMNFRFEIPIDHPSIRPDDIFITDFNSNIIFGLSDTINNPTDPSHYFYVMNGNTGGWSRWDFDYTEGIASPGSEAFKAQGVDSIQTILVFNDFSKKHIVYSEYKPHPSLNTYHLDSDTANYANHDYLYIPPITIKTSASFGDSPLKFAKLYRTYMRFYMSDIPKKQVPSEDAVFWTLSINYDSYKFQYDTSVEGNPLFNLYPSTKKFAEIGANPMDTVADNATAIYQRTFKVPIPQQRIREFVIELKRVYTKLSTPLDMINYDSDRPIKAGYYFMLSSFWIDYQDKQES